MSRPQLAQYCTIVEMDLDAEVAELEKHLQVASRTAREFADVIRRDWAGRVRSIVLS